MAFIHEMEREAVANYAYYLGLIITAARFYFTLTAIQGLDGRSRNIHLFQITLLALTMFGVTSKINYGDMRLWDGLLMAVGAILFVREIMRVILVANLHADFIWHSISYYVLGTLFLWGVVTDNYGYIIIHYTTFVALCTTTVSCKFGAWRLSPRSLASHGLLVAWIVCAGVAHDPNFMTINLWVHVCFDVSLVILVLVGCTKITAIWERESRRV